MRRIQFAAAIISIVLLGIVGCNKGTELVFSEQNFRKVNREIMMLMNKETHFDMLIC